MRGINVMAEVDVPGHAESWGAGYPDLWPSPSCREPLDVSKTFTFDVISGILAGCWTSTSHVKEWIQNHNMTAKDAYEYFVLKAQDIAFSKNWTPVNWEETLNAFPTKLHRQTVVHNWLLQKVSGAFSVTRAPGILTILMYLGSWNEVYTAEPLEAINKASEQKLVLGEVCMWGETVDTSDVQQTIWPQAAAAAERLWSQRDSTST